MRKDGLAGWLAGSLTGWLILNKISHTVKGGEFIITSPRCFVAVGILGAE